VARQAKVDQKRAVVGSDEHVASLRDDKQREG
jgi:hypothetical protein